MISREDSAVALRRLNLVCLLRIDRLKVLHVEAVAYFLYEQMSLLEELAQLVPLVK